MIFPRIVRSLAAVVLIAAILLSAVDADARKRGRRKRRVRLPDPSTIPAIGIDKGALTLDLISTDGDTLFHTRVATGLAPGQKRRPGDMRTPEGSFIISEIVDASRWKHDFGDGLGKISGAYGPLFMRLLTPGHSGIGIHGTHLPASIGTRASEGCIRLENDSLLRLSHMVCPGTRVTILPGFDDDIASLLDRDSVYLAHSGISTFNPE